MDEKNLAALERGPEWMLAKLANITAKNVQKRASEFYKQYGDLYPGWGIDHQAEVLYTYYASMFRRAWHAETQADREAVSQLITSIFERDITADKLGLVRATPFEDTNDPESRPAVVADFESGKITIKPRTLLDWLAKSLLEYRDKLAICERSGCERPYFVKTHARQRFCSHDCANSARELKKKRWWAENRDRYLKKWRRERKAKRQSKRKSFKRSAPLC